MAEKRQQVLEAPEPTTPKRSPVPRVLPRDEAYALGKKLREACPRDAHAKCIVAARPRLTSQKSPEAGALRMRPLDDRTLEFVS